MYEKVADESRPEPIDAQPSSRWTGWVHAPVIARRDWPVLLGLIQAIPAVAGLVDECRHFILEHEPSGGLALRDASVASNGTAATLLSASGSSTFTPVNVLDVMNAGRSNPISGAGDWSSR